MEFTLPIGEMRCAECGRGPKQGEEFVVMLYAGSAWKDGYAEITEGAELYYAKGFCADHAPASGAADPEAK